MTYSKKAQTSHNRIKQKPERDKAYLEWLQTYPAQCLICGSNYSIQWHHIKRNSSDAKNDHEMIPLCVHHHTGQELSPHGTPKKWREKFSMEAQREIASIYYAQYCEEVS